MVLKNTLELTHLTYTHRRGGSDGREGRCGSEGRWQRGGGNARRLRLRLYTRPLARPGPAPRLAEVRRFSYIAHGTRTGGRSRVRTVRYCLYDVYTVRMHRDIAPVRVPTAPATLQSHRHTQNDTDTAHDHALQSCSMRHDLSHMHA